MTKKTVFEVLYQKFKKKPATRAEIDQLKLELEKEEIKAKLRKIKLEGRQEKMNNFSRVMDDLFGKPQNVKTPRF